LRSLFLPFELVCHSSMASDLEKAKDAITGTDSTDPNLNATLEEAKELQFRITVEMNRHKETLHAREWLEKMAPIIIAGIAMIGGIVGAFFSIYMASKSTTPDSAEYWYKIMERSFAFAAVALSFIFGRSGRR